MRDRLMQRTIEIFTTRLQTLDRLLRLAEEQSRTKGRDPEELCAARLAEDMFPLPHQIVFACNQPNAFAAWCAGAAPPKTDPKTLGFAGMRHHIGETIRYLVDATGKVQPDVLDRDKHIELLHGLAINLPGELYVEDWLLPNFYFHLVTAYDILRHEGIAIGKADYMAHLAPRVEAAARAKAGNG